MKLGMNIVLNRLNYNKIKDMIELCHEIGFDLAYFEPIYPGYLSKERLSLNEEEKEEMQDYIKQAVRTANKLKIELLVTL